MFPQCSELPRSHIIELRMINGDLNKPNLIAMRLHSFPPCIPEIGL